MKTKFKQKNGLTAYALACGYVQRIETDVPGKNTRLDLWHEGACFHVRAHDFINAGRIEWVSEELLSDARDQFKYWLKKLFSEELKEISKDKRYSFDQEYHGESDISYICRFNGCFIGASETLEGAKMKGYNHKYKSGE